MMATPAPIPSDQSPPDQQTYPISATNAELMVLHPLPPREFSLSQESSIHAPSPSPTAAHQVSLPMAVTRRHVLWPVGSQSAVMKSVVALLKICSDPAIKRSYSTMETASEFSAVEDDDVTDPNTALIVFDKKKEFWQVAFQGYKRLKADVEEGTCICPSSYSVQEIDKVEEDLAFYDGEDLQDEEWVEFLAYNMPHEHQMLMECLDVYDEEQLRLAMRRERRLRREHGTDWYESSLAEKEHRSCPSSPVSSSVKTSHPLQIGSALIVQQNSANSHAENQETSLQTAAISGAKSTFHKSDPITQPSIDKAPLSLSTNNLNDGNLEPVPISISLEEAHALDSFEAHPT